MKASSLLKAAAVLSATTIAYLKLARLLVLDWGATREEAGADAWR
jgi:hypothetical protein